MAEDFLFNIKAGERILPVYRASYEKLGRIAPFRETMEAGIPSISVEEPNVELKEGVDGSLYLHTWKSDTIKRTFNQEGYDKWGWALSTVIRILLEPPGKPIDLNNLSISEQIVLYGLSVRQCYYIFEKATEGVE